LIRWPECPSSLRFCPYAAPRIASITERAFDELDYLNERAMAAGLGKVVTAAG